MTPAEIIERVKISEVWNWLGGEPLKKGRAKAFWRQGNNDQSISLNDTKNVFFDHRDSKGGGVLGLIQAALGLNSKDAAKWLADQAGLPLDDHQPGRSTKSRYLAAKTEAIGFVEWRAKLLVALTWDYRHWNQLRWLSLRYVLKEGFEAKQSALMATLHEYAEERCERISGEIQTMREVTDEELLPIWRAMR